METFKSKPAEPRPNFCALEYIPDVDGHPLPTIRNIILLVLRDADCGLRFLIHPGLRQIVKAVDLSYIKSLLEDFILRVKLNAEFLFKQLCSLSVGLLSTRAIGDQIVEYPDIHELVVQFASL